MLISSRAFRGLAPCVLLICAATSRAAADVVYSQPTVIDPAKVGLGFFSSTHPRNNRSYKHGDDFTLATDARLTGVRWWGESEGRLFDDLRNFDQYTIEVFEGVPAGGGPLPGALLWRQTFLATQLSITPTGRIAPLSGAAEHLYEAALPAVVDLAGGVAYILAVSARSINRSGDAWQWQDGEFFGGHSALYTYATGLWTSFEDTDSAFELIGTPVPAPGAAVTLMGLAIAAPRRRARRA